jgi:FkbM family methyltransferase
MAFRNFRDAQHLNREPVVTPLGFSFVGHPLMETGRFEPVEVALISRLLTQVDAFVNVGANMGYYCALALHRGVPVVAVEPVPANLQVLYRNLRCNGAKASAEVHPVALGEAPGLVDIYGGGTAASLLRGWAGLPDAYKQTVPLSTLDTVLAGRFLDQRLLILIDVEGAELGVFKGAAAQLSARVRPIWVVEITIDEHLPDGVKLNPNMVQTFEVFEKLGYGVWLVAEPLRRLRYEEVRTIAATGKNTFDSHNFLFADPAVMAA